MAGICAEKYYTGIDAAELVAGGGRYDVQMAERALARLSQPPDMGALAADGMRLMRSQWPRVHLLANALARYQELTYAEVMSLCRPYLWHSPRWAARAARPPAAGSLLEPFCGPLGRL